MFGAITFLPLYFQVVKGVNPTVSGLRLLPMMAGLLLTSIGSGQLIGRWGRYKIFPIIGTAMMTIGLLLLSRLGPHTSATLTSLYMFVFGLGLGSVMQVLVITVQNAVDYKDLGAATSGTTYFRSIGGSFGTAVFGSIFADQLSSNIAHYLGPLRLPAGFTSATLSPSTLNTLPGTIHNALIQAYAASLHTVFLTAAPVAAFAFVLSWLLPEVKLRKTVAATDPGETLGMPTTRSSLQELERAVAVLAQNENRVALYRRIAAGAGLEGLRPAACCLLARIGDQPGLTVFDLAEQIRIPVANVAPIVNDLIGRQLVSVPSETGGNGATPVLAVTDQGQSALDRLVAARCTGLADLLDGWSPKEHHELDARLQTMAREFIDSDVQKLRTDKAFNAAA